MEIRNFDAVIIGFGKGGKTLAAALGKKGRTVAVIERDPGMYGGTCINVGCIPSKSLVLSASQTDPAAPFEQKAVHYAAAIEEKRRVTAMLRQKNYDKLASLPTVTVIDGTARFIGERLVEVSTAQGRSVLHGENVFINTGSASRIPPIEGADEPGVYTSRGLMDLNVLPRRLVIVGAGYIGLEFASMYSSFGSRVTVLQDSDVFLPREDADVAEGILSALKAQDIEFITGARTRRIDKELSLTVDTAQGEQRIEADAVLLATGRAPATKGLGCETAGVELTPRGAVVVDEHLRTTAPGVWAMGDVTGGLQHTYISLDDERIVLDALLGDGIRSTADRTNVPYSVFMALPLARVGLNEREAGEKGLDFRVVKLPAAAIPKAQVLRQTSGFLKALIDNKSGLILGAELLCARSYEMINLISLAMDAGVTYSVLRDRIYTHPTMTEAFNDLFAL